MAPPNPQQVASTKSSASRWAALVAALLGWMFDGAEMGLFSMVGRSAIKDLMQITDPKDEAIVGFWFGVIIAIFLIGAATGGVLFGWLGDRIGRVRAMTLSVLTYALFTGACGFVGSAWQIGVLRFIASLGMGGEWSLGVALVMEVWPNKSRALMAGLIGASANLGYILVGVLGIGLNSTLSMIKSALLGINLPPGFVESMTAHQGWRILMILGALPAILTFLIRIFVPESEKWEHEQGKGTTSHWETRDLFGVLIGSAGPLLMIIVWAGNQVPWWGRLIVSFAGLAIAILGYLYPVKQYLKRLQATSGISDGNQTLKRMLLGAALSGVALMGTWGSVQWASSWAHQLTSNRPELQAREWTQIASGFGAVVGTILAALMGDVLGRRVSYMILCFASLFSSWYFYGRTTEYDMNFLGAVFVLGACTASFYGWLPLYLPELFHSRVRATGQGFSFNFGRILAAIGALQAGALMKVFDSPFPIHIGGIQVATLEPGYPAACGCLSMIYLVGVVIIWLAPETHGKDLPE